MSMQSYMLMKQSKAVNKENKPSKCSDYESQLSKMGISRLKSLINYNKHLGELRVQQNPDHLKQSRKFKKKFSQLRFSELQSYFQERERTQHGEQIKFSQAFSYGNTTQIILATQKEIGTLQSNQLLSSTNQKIRNKNNAKSSKQLIQTNITNCELQTISNKNYVLHYANEQQLNITKHFQWGNNGLNLCVVNPLLQQKIYSLSQNYEQDYTQNNYQKLKQEKCKPKLITTISNQLNKLKIETIESQGHQFKRESQDSSHQSLLLNKENQIYSISLKQQSKAKSKIENDLQRVYQNYKVKKKVLGKNTKFMTDKREEAIFINELMKVALKYDSLDEFKEFSQRKKAKIEAMALNKTKQIKQNEPKQRQAKLFTIGQFKQTYKHVLNNIHNLATEKL